MAESPDDLELWHRRLGHLHYKYMVAYKSLASGISFTIRFAEKKLELRCLSGRKAMSETF